MSLSADSNIVEPRGLPMLSAFRLHSHGCQAEMSKIVATRKKTTTKTTTTTTTTTTASRYSIYFL